MKFSIDINVKLIKITTIYFECSLLRICNIFLKNMKYRNLYL